MTQKSWITSVSKDGISDAARLHPEIAEFAVQILKRDLKLIKRYCPKIKSFIRSPYKDLHEIDTFLQQAQARGMTVDLPIVGVMVINFAPETNARIPLTAEQWKNESMQGTTRLVINRPDDDKGFKP